MMGDGNDICVTGIHNTDLASNADKSGAHS